MLRHVVVTYYFFFFNDTATTEIYTLSLHDALPISCAICTHLSGWPHPAAPSKRPSPRCCSACSWPSSTGTSSDRKSTRLNSSHANISYAVFCLKKKKKNNLSRTL